MKRALMLAITAAAIIGILAVVFGPVSFSGGGNTAAKPRATSAKPSSDEGDRQPQPRVLPMPTYPRDSSCGTKGEVNGLDAQGVLEFEGLCVPLTVPPSDYAKWTTGEDGDWVKDERGKVDLCQPSGCTSVLFWLSPKALTSPERAAQLWGAHDECANEPESDNAMKIGGLLAVHILLRGCDDGNLVNHDWFVQRPDGRVIVIVAESPETMDPGTSDGASTPARVGESMAKAKYFG